MSWPVAKLGDVAQIFNGKTPSKNEKRDNGFPILKIKDINTSSEFKGNFDSYVDDKFYKQHSKKKIKVGDTLILNAAHNSNHVGSKQFKACLKVDGTIATGEWLIVRPNSEFADNSYVNYWLMSKKARFYIRDLVKGIHLYPKDVARLQIPLPPLNEQKRIAAILDKADAVRRKRQQAIELSEQLLRSVFLDMFGDPVTNPMGWQQVSFSSVGVLERGKSKHRPRNDPILLGGKYPLIQTGDIANSKGYVSDYNETYSEVGLKQSKLWPIGTLCITIAANIAKTAILEIEACFPDSVVGFKSNGLVTIEYIQYWLGFLQKIIEEAAPESAQKNINLEILRNLNMPLPDIQAQRKFSEVVQSVNKNRKLHIDYEKFAHVLFNSLSQKAFKGELTELSETELA